MQSGVVTHQRTLPTHPWAVGRHQLAAEVRRLAAGAAEWLPRVRLDPGGRWYERVHLDDSYEAWLISWLPGQSTGFHDHGGSVGAFGIVLGALDEYVVGRDGVPTATRLEGGTRAAVRAFGPRCVHDVRNSSAATVAVSVHAYSPPLATMTRYELGPAGLVASGTEGADIW